MFLFIVLNWVTGRGYTLIQIHLMFLFIITEITALFSSSNSNTSHVLIYPLLIWYKSSLNPIQIHLMFLFITAAVASCVSESFVFKNISCSYLSLPVMEFGTPVTVFKYISCSYLSPKSIVFCEHMLIFKYISCSYLSKL